MIKSDQEAIEAGRKFLMELGIEVLDVERAQKVDGSVRSKYLPDSASDLWMINSSAPAKYFLLASVRPNWREKSSRP